MDHGLSQVDESLTSIITEGAQESLNSSSLSSSAGDVLVRSTSVQASNRSCGKRDKSVMSNGLSCGESVKITVKKLRETLSPLSTDEARKHDKAFIPPALPANKPAASNTGSRRDSTDDRGTCGQSAAALLRPRAAGHSQEQQTRRSWSCKDGRKLNVSTGPPEGSRNKGHDIVISQYSVGGKEAVRAVFKERCRSAPVRKAVKVQLLEPQEPPPAGPPPPQPCTADTVAVVTAAAIAATAPLLKAQHDLDTKISSVSELLKKLQHVERQPCQEERVAELEKQLAALTHQRLQHLEQIQQQQLELQTRLLGGALSAVSGSSAPAPPVSSHLAAPAQPGLQRLPGNASRDESPAGAPASTSTAAAGCPPPRVPAAETSPLETPAPRRFVPVPMSRDAAARRSQEKPAVEKSKVASGRLGSGRLLEEILNTQGLQSARGRSVTMATGGSYTERNSCSRKAEEAASAAVKKASDVLRDLGQLKTEMQSLLQVPEVFPLERSRQARPNRGPAASDPPPPPPPPPPAPLEGSLHPLKSASLPQSSDPMVLQKTKAPKSMFEDAEKVLRQVKQHKKVLEENLEAILRANDGAVLHSQIEALSSNRDASGEIRIKKTVDEWIGTISKDIQAEIARKDFVSQMKGKDKEAATVSSQKGQGAKGIRQQRDVKNAAQSKLITAARKPLNTSKPFRKAAEGHVEKPNVQSKSFSHFLQKKEPILKGQELEDEEYLQRVYGRAVYQGHRSTLKRAPYLRINSPSPKSKPQRPRVVESVKGIKVKSARTQTGLFPPKKTDSRPAGQPFSHELDYVFSPSRDVPSTGIRSAPLEGLLIPVAIPLGVPRLDGAAPQPSSVTTVQRQPVTVTTSVPPCPPKPPAGARKPNVALLEMRSEKKDPPTLTVQVLPSVDINSVSSESPAPSTPLAQPNIQTVEQAQTQEEDSNEFPGTDYVAVTDIAQDSEEEDGLSEAAIEINGQVGPALAPYHGPSFPPSAPEPRPTIDAVEVRIQQRETLENRLVDWVEQQLMARVIAELYPPRVQAAEDSGASELEDSGPSTSDIVEAAGGGGVQLFVEAGVPVDSELIRQYVNDALAETIAIMLGQREGQRPASPPAALEVPAPPKEPVVPTPVPTPQLSPHPSPPPSGRAPSPVRTPDVSERESAAEFSEAELEPSAPVHTEPEEEHKSPVITPAATPIPSPHPVATPSPPEPERNPSPEPARPLPSSWEDAQLPLEEEDPRPDREEQQSQRAVVMSVAQEEETVSLVTPSPPVAPQAPTPTPPPPLQAPPTATETPPPPTPSTEDSSSTASVTETDTAGRNISEGELLFSYGQLAAARALAEGGLTLPNLSASLSSSLHGFQDMDYDPPSEGQVIRRPDIQHHRDPVLSLLARMNQGLTALQEGHVHPQIHSDDDSSMGEVSEGQRPRLPAAGETLLTGHSLLLDQSSLNAETVPEQEDRSLSPGQQNHEPGVALRDSQDTYGPMSLRDLDEQPVPLPRTRPVAVRPSQPVDIRGAPQATEIPRAEQGPPPILVRQYSHSTEDEAERGDHYDDDHLTVDPSDYFKTGFQGMDAGPCSLPQLAPVEEEPSASLSAEEGDADSSGTDVF
ncbi:protein TALPID3 isoform X2 [Lepisosteus oculatus]|uniref:protein TALPID3 isoform X2 n=1 Tax=Lepisosteus oculatus TaxID=7918 RepID=UPI0037163B49